MTTTDLGDVLETAHVVRSAKWFRFALATRFGPKSIVVGDYIFERPQNVLGIAYRMVHGIYGNSRIKVTFPEGITAKEMGEILFTKIPDFPIADFLQQSAGREGFLFPETYYFFRTTRADQVITTLSDQFISVVAKLSAFDNGITKEKLGGKNRTLVQVVTMASILEREARNADEARVISGILWKRLQNNMPLQVDATFLYTINKGTAQLSLRDLRKDGPYNTYTRTGLPAGPIGNPGRAMIDAALHPTVSPYWYYLHDSNGGVHYAKSYQEHLMNKQKYLK